ncbi:hydroxyisourate hydrolase [Glycomyces sp. NPDC046736]|uniref:hydroxyisourate hydrolase n=1 Tax=Glycomyces sp. NPDC046736 TaxID=3155615 RepID=UPI0033EBB435
MSTVSSHVLDAALGRPAAGLGLTLYRREGDGFAPVRTGTTDSDGRVAGWTTEPGLHRLRFATGDWFATRGTPTFYPEIDIVFDAADPEASYHVPLLLSPFAYSTYRGS